MGINDRKIACIDTHSHLYTHIHYNPPSLDDVIKNAKHVGVERVIVCGSNYKTSEKAISLSDRYNGFIYPAVGVSYNFARLRNPEEPLGQYLQQHKSLRQLLKEVNDIEELIKKRQNKIVAIGEIGIDTGITKENRYVDQIRIFEECLKLAEKYRKGISVHSFSKEGYRNSERDALEILSDYNIKPVVMHFFQGSKEETEEAVKRGYYISVAPSGRNADLDERMKKVVERTPLESLLVESDGPRPVNGIIDLNIQPSLLPVLIEKTSEIKKRDVGEVGRALHENAERLFF